MTGATHQNHQHLDDIKEVPPTFLAARNLHRHRCLEIPAVILPLNTRHRQKCKPRRYLDLEGGTRSSDIVVVCSQRLYDIEDITVVEGAKFTHHLSYTDLVHISTIHSYEHHTCSTRATKTITNMQIMRG